MSARPIVVFLAGSGRSGSTVLSALLGQRPGWFAAGEVRYLWDRGLLERRLCGCGTPVPDCPVWDSILRRAFGDRIPDPEAAVRRRAAVDGMANVVRPFLGTRARARLADRLGDHPRDLERLYLAAAEVTGSRVIVDSSKLPTYGWVLDDLTGLDVRVVHLLRDPRATAYSWTRTKPTGDGSTMHRMGPARSAALWTLLNGAAARRWPRSAGHLRVRYEDFVVDPRAVLARIAALADDAPTTEPFLDDRTARLEPLHAVAGNPDRHRCGDVTIRPDDAWRRGLGARDRLLVSAITAPIRPFLGY